MYYVSYHHYVSRSNNTTNKAQYMVYYIMYTDDQHSDKVYLTVNKTTPHTQILITCDKIHTSYHSTSGRCENIARTRTDARLAT